MRISEFSVIMSIACSSIILFATGFLVSHVKRVRWGLILLIMFLGFARLSIPIEFRAAKEITVRRIYWSVYAFAHKKWGSVSFSELLLFVWGVGLLVLLIRFLRDVKSVRSISNRAVPVVEGDTLYGICEKAALELGYGGRVRLAVTRELDTAVSIGFLKPNILIPEEMLSYSETELKGVIKHELTHFLRGDVGKQRVLIFVQCLFWWNPVISYLKKCVEGMLELECDEHACMGMSEEDRLAYLDAIAKVLRNDGAEPVRLGMGWRQKFTETFLYRRFQELLHPVERHSDAVTCFLAAMSIVLFCLSYSVIVQPGASPAEVKTTEVSKEGLTENWKEINEFLIRLPDGTYLYVADMLGEKHLREDEIQESPYVDLPIFDDIGE